MLNKTGRRWLRVIHLVFIASLVGSLVAILIVNRISGLDLNQLYITNLVMYTLFNQIVTYSFYGIVATGLIYSVFTHWGLTKHWWVIAKWLGTLTVFTLVWVWLGPAINGLVALADGGLIGESDHFLYHDLRKSIEPAIFAALAIFFGLMSLTVFKPWGQRSQAYALRRGTILGLTGFAVIMSLGLGLLGYYDLESYRKLEIKSPDLERISNGTYQGKVTYAGFDTVVDVTVDTHKIVKIKIQEDRESPYTGYSNAIIPRVLKAQTPNVDGITGATTSSKLLMKAIESALEGALK